MSVAHKIKRRLLCAVCAVGLAWAQDAKLTDSTEAAPQQGEDRIRQIATELFSLLDANDNGMLNKMEVLQRGGQAISDMQALGIQVQVQSGENLLQACDADGNRAISELELWEYLRDTHRTHRGVAPDAISKQRSEPAPSSSSSSSTDGSTALQATGEEELVRHFIEQGYVEIRVPVSDMPRAVHRRIYERTLQLWDTAGRKLGAGLGNNVLPAVPELQVLLASPAVQRGLRAVLGPNYVLHSHRFLHHSSPNDQDFHQDSFWGRRRMRSHLPKWCMLLYYPQRVNSDMGPTVLLNGSHYLSTDHGASSLPPVARSIPYGEDRLDWAGSLNGTYSSADFSTRDRALAVAARNGFGLGASEAEELASPTVLTGPAGRVVIMHYDLFHRASRQTQRNFLSNVRFMFKMQFARTQAPSTGSVQMLGHYPDQWTVPVVSATNEAASLRDLLLPAWKSVRDWLSGTQYYIEPQVAASSSMGTAVRHPDQLHQCTEVLRAGLDEKLASSELKRIYCAYTLGRQVKFAASSDDANEALGSLATGLTSDTEAIRRASMHGLSAAGPRAVPVLLQILSSASGDAVKGAACHASGELQAEATVISSLLRSVVRTADEAAQGVSEDGDEERWISTREACISAAGSILMTAIGNPLLLEDSPPDELVDLVLEATIALVRWMSSAEPFVSAAGMRARDRQPGREAAAQGLVTLFGGVPKTQTVVLRLLAATNAAHPISTESVSGKTSVLSSLAAAVRRATVAADEPERYVLAWGLEIQRRMLNAQARLAATELVSSSSILNDSGSGDRAAGATAMLLDVGPELWQMRWCPHTNTSSPM